MVENIQHQMARTRALLTERERDVLAGEKGDSDDERYAKWEARNRIEDEMPKDVEILAAHHPDLLEELRAVVCDDGEGEADE